jgi:hypothetical protein
MNMKVQADVRPVGHAKPLGIVQRLRTDSRVAFQLPFSRSHEPANFRRGRCQLTAMKTPGGLPRPRDGAGERRLRHAGKTGGSIGTFVVWIYMYVRRISFIRASGVTPGQLSTLGALTQGVTRWRCRIRRTNLKNLFEIPVILCALALYLFVRATVDATEGGAAWVSRSSGSGIVRCTARSTS